MIIFLVSFLSLIILVSISRYIYFYLVRKEKQKKIDYVNTYSEKIKEINSINSRYNFKQIPHGERHRFIRLKSKKEFDNFVLEDNLCEIFSVNKKEIQNFIYKTSELQTKYKAYKKELEAVNETDFNLLPHVKFIKEEEFINMEDKKVNCLIKVIDDNPNLVITRFYRSPKGNRYYENSKHFSLLQCENLFRKIFGTSAMKTSNFNEQEEIFNKCKDLLKNDAYKPTQVIEILKIKGINVTEDMAISILIRSGFKISKNGQYYTKYYVKDMKDLILSSSDERGLITYNNPIKDDEYDNAIAKLQNDGRIIPIDNLHFLKISKSLNYLGVTLSVLTEFYEQLNQYVSRKKYFSLNQVKTNVDNVVCSSTFDDIFLSYIIKFSGFAKEVNSIKNLFTTIDDTERILFLKSFFENEKSINAYDLSVYIEDNFDVDYPVNSMKYDIEKVKSKTSLYYNEDTEKIYLNKDIFFDEMEELL